MGEYPDYVPNAEWPERSVENIPDDVLQKALRSVRYQECPHCGERQWVNYVAGHNRYTECKECGGGLTLVG